jgi:hypothetical protein
MLIAIRYVVAEVVAGEEVVAEGSQAREISMTIKMAG